MLKYTKKSILICLIASSFTMYGCNITINLNDNTTSSSKTQVEQSTDKQSVKKETHQNKNTTNINKQAESSVDNKSTDNTLNKAETKKNQSKKITPEESNENQKCMICGKFVPMSDAQDCNGGIAHSECMEVHKQHCDPDIPEDNEYETTPAWQQQYYNKYGKAPTTIGDEGEIQDWGDADWN